LPLASSPSADVVVIGGGVIGLAGAWRAAQRGLRVTVLERDRIGGGTSAVAAGMLAPVAEADPAEQPLLELGLAAARAYPRFIEDLSEASPLPTGYRACGTLLAARDGDEAQGLLRALELRQRLNLSAVRLAPSRARTLEPALSPTLRLALELPEDHAVDPGLLCAALADAVRRAGGEIREASEVSELIRQSQRERVCGVRLASGEELACDQVLVAAGVWSASLGGLPADALPPVRPIKGQILRLHDPAGPGLLTRVLRMADAYVVPRGDGRYVLGATMEERGFDCSITAGAVWQLLRDAVELLPGISELVVDEIAAGLRPGTPDNAPVIGHGALPGLLWATGHHRGGVLLAPITGEAVSALLAGEPPAVELSAFDAGRFAPTTPAAGLAGATR